MLLSSSSADSIVRREAGGKGLHLYLLTKEGLPVPKWQILSARVFQEFKAQNQLPSKIEEFLASKEGLGQIAESIRQLILGTPFSAEHEALIRKAFGFLSAARIAVRSSALDEDAAQHSFAGQLSTFLYIRNEEETLAAVKECWASGFSERGLSYRKENNLPLGSDISVAVVLQEMVDAEKSGVLFTCDPISGDTTKSTINAVYGIGEGLVSGLLDADTYSLSKTTGDLIQSDIVEKTSQLVQNPRGGGTCETPVPGPLQQVPALNALELHELQALSQKVERFYRFPQDIEWAFHKGQFFILQSRPVTTSMTSSEGLLYIWDNSNIIESYGGITLPLTFTFARFVYHQVYIQFCEILMIPSREIRNMDYFLRNMLGSFYGRVYYNILNWYKLTSILPGFKYNRGFMETMMGTAHSLEDEIAVRIKPPGFQESFVSKVRRFLTGLKFFYYHLTIQGMVDRFLASFHRSYDLYRKRDYSRLPADEIYEYYQEMERLILRQWHAPIVNDYLCMVHFGILKKLTGLWLPQLGTSIQNDLMCGEGNLESAEPTRELIRMAGLVAKIPDLKKLFEQTPSEDMIEVLGQSNFEDFKKRVHLYIDKYGFRCMSEMKLEQKDLHQDPTFLFVCIKNYLRADQIDLEVYEKREKEIRSRAEILVRQSLGPIRRIIYFWSLKHARKAVRNRENTRFCRTRIYGVVRAMFYGIGRDYTLRGILEQAEDIFYLTLQELSGSLEGSLVNQDLKAQVALRKKDYLGFGDKEPAPRFMTRGPTYWMNEHMPPEAAPVIPKDLPPGALVGIGCCPGIIEGTVKVVLSPEDDMDLNGEILVTLRTDPGWIPLYPAASGLLVERGGLLSHSAIVAREMGLPTIVGVKGLTKTLKTGMKVRFNGETGIIEPLGDA